MTKATETKAEISARMKELESKMKKLLAYTKQVKAENEKLKKTNLLENVITEQGCNSFSIKNYIQNELVILCHNNQNQYTLPMSRKDGFMLLFVNAVYMINNYCDYLTIEENEKNGVYNIQLFEDKMPDKVKGYFNYTKGCNFTTDRQRLQNIKAAELAEIESILQTYGYSLSTVNE